MCTSPLRAFYTGAKTDKGGDLLAVSRNFSCCETIRYEQALKVAREKFPVNHRYMYLDAAGYWQLYKYVDVPCGQCLECKESHARMWADRCMLEANHSHDCHFVTLTYKESPGSISKRDFQLFVKRLRKRVGNGVRFFGCGEYGTKTLRPHYHLILFNCPLTKTQFSAREIEDAWRFGFSMVGDVTQESVAYVARYTDKKLIQDKLPLDYEPPFILMSRMPGIGEQWLSEHLDQIKETDRIYFAFSVDRFSACPPRYADKLMLKNNMQEVLIDNKLKREVSGFRAQKTQEVLHKADHEELLNIKRQQSILRSEKRERNL